jgi:hypothetical protein
MCLFCVHCGTEIPTPPDGVVRSGYCSDACWNEWLEKHKNDILLHPYVPLQISHVWPKEKP